MPWLYDEVWVEYCVHLNCYVGRDGDDGGEVEYPAEKVEGAGEEAEDATIAGAGGHRGPVIDAASGGDGGGELGITEQSWRKVGTAGSRIVPQR